MFDEISFRRLEPGMQMIEPLEEKLAKIERGDAEALRFFGQATRVGHDLFMSDFVIVGALKRTLALSEGFRGLIRERNFTCAGALLRLQLDTALRLYAATLYVSPEEYAKAVFNGERVDKLKDRAGNRMTDSYLAGKLNERHPWIEKVYDNLCDLVHFSNRHIFTSITSLDDEERIIRFQISAKDPPRPDEDYFEIADAFYEIMKITVTLAAGWTKALRTPRNPDNQ